MLKDILPDKQRKLAYKIFAIASLLVGAVQLGFLTAGLGLPVAVKVALAVLPYLGAGFGFTAASNVPLDTSGTTSTDLAE